MAAFARDWALKRQEAQKTTGRGTFVQLVFEPGEAFQFAWNEDWAVLGGERTKLQVARFKLSRSRAFYVRASRFKNSYAQPTPKESKTKKLPTA